MRSRREATKRPAKPTKGATTKKPDAAAKRALGGAKRASGGLATGLKRGAGETRGRTKAAAPGLARKLLALAGAVFGVFFDVLAVFLNAGIAVGRVVAAALRRLLATLGRLTAIASRLLTPARALTLVLIGALVLLALSQFADYRSISIGTNNYADGIQTVAPAPERVRDEAGSAHSYAFVPVAAVCLLLLALAQRGRWRLCRLIALGGVAAIVIALVIDRPEGLDPGQQAIAYEGVRANLLGGFYAQIFSGLLVAVSAMLLGRELQLTAETKLAPQAERSRPRRSLRRSLPGKRASA